MCGGSCPKAELASLGHISPTATFADQVPLVFGACGVCYRKAATTTKKSKLTQMLGKKIEKVLASDSCRSYSLWHSHIQFQHVPVNITPQANRFFMNSCPTQIRGQM